MFASTSKHVFTTPPTTPISSPFVQRRLKPLPSSRQQQQQRQLTRFARSLRLSPSSRTRLQNASFLTATLLSVAIVSLTMSGTTGVDLPCPARQGTRVGMQHEQDEQDWNQQQQSVEEERQKRVRSSAKGKSRWLEEPIVNVVAAMENPSKSRILHQIEAKDPTSSAAKRSESERIEANESPRDVLRPGSIETNSKEWWKDRRI